jgi:Trk K+ transport system NAD-binding subunit
MIHNDVIIFGANEYAMEIAKKIAHSRRNIHIYVSDSDAIAPTEASGFKTSTFDLSDNWDNISESHNIDDVTIFCALEDDAQNVFLTISLRAAFENVFIIALATDEESANKIKMAGANKVIPVKQTTANIIVGELESPITSDVLYNILYDESNLKMAQLRVAENSKFVGTYLHDVKWNEQYGIIVLAVVDQEISTSFIFTSRGQKHQLDPGDLLIVIGYDQDIKAFEREIGGHDG